MYVKWFDTVMSYYVILVKFSNFPAFRPRTSRHHRERNPEDGCRHRPEDIAGDTAGGT
ncbi:unnamed protein product, partial [Staurois parvus]